MAVPTLSTVIVVHNSMPDLVHALPPLTAQMAPGDELIVVDSGSEDDLSRELPKLAPNAHLIVADGNVGFAVAANLGAAAARGDLIVLLNPDAVVQPGWAEAIKAPYGGEWAAWM